MHTPTKKQMQIVIDNLEKVLPMAVRDEQLDMREPDVNRHNHVCGSVHCLGGWYAVAILDTTKSLGFLDGAQKMAEDLGFIIDDSYNDPDDLLTDWAFTNPDLWGNNNGNFMFTYAFAFSSPCRPDGARNLKDIVEHLKEVQARLPK